MPGDNNLDRRQLLKTIAAGGALAKWPALAAAASLPADARFHYTVLSPEQAALLEALVDQLIPADDFPGAKDSGVVAYIDRKLGGPYGGFFVQRYQTGLKQFDDLCRQKLQRPFVSLDSTRQTEVLEAIANNTYGSDQQNFFETVLSDTYEGYYGSPEDGGNRDGASWKMIGFKG